jgi:hypothetical protein
MVQLKSVPLCKVNSESFSLVVSLQPGMDSGH